MTHADQGCKCKHGVCLDHKPEWENIGAVRLEPNPGIFGSKWWISREGSSIRCCGERMAKYKEVQTQQCRKCKRTRDCVENYHIALCLCCGNSFTNLGYVFL